jgi:deoxyribonuclease V
MPLIREAACLYDVHTVVVDGFVDLGEGRPGLGRHLFAAFAAQVAVVGVAKSAFAGAPALPVLRGSSRKPLWVTSTGDVEVAAQHIVSMAGAHRLPDLLKLTDSLARGKGAGGLGLGLP